MSALDVHALRDGLKMHGIDTHAIAAPMIEHQTFRNRATQQQPHRAMGCDRAAASTPAEICEASLTARKPRADPEPASRVWLRLDVAQHPLHGIHSCWQGGPP